MPQRATLAKRRNNDEELITASLFQGGNRFQATDGRTYQYVDADGKYISARVSPYSPNIFNNVEPEIRDVVLSLIGKGYLPCSSCQGHSDRRYRFVTVAFNTRTQLEKFKEDVRKFRLPIHFKEHNLKDPVCEFKVVYDQTKFKDTQLSMDQYKQLSNSYADIVKYFNIMFLREYTQYHLLEFRIASSPDVKNMLEYLLYKPYYYMWYLFRNYFTKKLNDKISTMPEYEDKL